MLSNHGYLELFKKPKSFIIWLLLLLYLVINIVKADTLTCNVINVHDGDTFTCYDNTKIRIWGIDTPEIPPKVSNDKAIKNNGYKAKDYLKNKIQGKSLACNIKGKSYKRIVAQCFVNKEDIAVYMLNSGYARELNKYSKGYYSH